MKKKLLWVVPILGMLILVGSATANNGPKDPDSDGLGNPIETNIYGTDPNDWDSDNDRVSDGLEVASGSDPLDGFGPESTDDDYDGIGNAYESNIGTDIQDWDTDDDGYSDGFEVASGMNPLVADGDGGGSDPDTDGLSSPVEDSFGTNPQTWDTDGDLYGDDVEIIAGTDPNDPMSYPTSSSGEGTGASVTKLSEGSISTALVFIILMLIAIAYGVFRKK